MTMQATKLLSLIAAAMCLAACSNAQPPKPASSPSPMPTSAPVAEYSADEIGGDPPQATFTLRLQDGCLLGTHANKSPVLLLFPRNTYRWDSTEQTLEWNTHTYAMSDAIQLRGSVVEIQSDFTDWRAPSQCKTYPTFFVVKE